MIWVVCGKGALLLSTSSTRLLLDFLSKLINKSSPPLANLLVVVRLEIGGRDVDRSSKLKSFC